MELCHRAWLCRRSVLMPEGTAFRALYKLHVWQEIDGFLHTVARQAHIQS